MLEHNFVKFNISSEYLIKSLHNKNDIFSIFNILICVQCFGNKLYVNLLIEVLTKIYSQNPTFIKDAREHT